MSQEILINVEPEEKRVAIIENKILEEFYVERPATRGLVGNIYKGIVESVVPGMGAAFVQLGLEKNGFLYAQDIAAPDYERMAEIADKAYLDVGLRRRSNHKRFVAIKDVLKKGQQLLVQVVKEPVGRKGPRLTTHITLPGRYLVLMPRHRHRGISRRIQEEKERTRLKELLGGLKIPSSMGLIVRTAGSGSTKRELAQDLRYLLHLWRRIEASLRKRRAPALIHEEYDLVLRIIRDKFSSQTNRLWVDSRDEYKRIMQFLRIFTPHLRSKVSLYQQDLGLFETKGVEEQIAKIYERKVVLKSGGYITIEPTEGLVAIDVNSGRFTKETDPEESAYLVNLEAAREIARQLRLRDIGGIIIIDFIDMKLPEYRQRVFAALNEATRRDYARTEISTVSKLGLVEMTRQRVRTSLEKQIMQRCPYCQGKGLVKSAATMAILITREIKKLLQRLPKRTLLIFAHPDVAFHLINEHRQSIYNLENQFQAKILVRQEPNLHQEEFRIEPV